MKEGNGINTVEVRIILKQNPQVTVTPGEDNGILMADPLPEKRKSFGKRLTCGNIIIGKVGKLFYAAPELAAYLGADYTGKLINGMEILIKLDCADFNNLVHKTGGFLDIGIIPFKVHYYILHRYTSLRVNFI